MTHIRITIDDTVEFDGSVTEWSRTPPDKFRHLISKHGVEPAPHMKGVLVAVADAIISSKSVDVVARTSTNWWAVDVTYR